MRYLCPPLFLKLLLLLLPGLAWADEVRVAVASNFTVAVQRLAPLFERETGHRLKPSFGATGKLYAQIRQSAPFDLLLAADDSHGQLLIESGLGVSGSAFIYAVGRLVLWSRQPDRVLGEESLRQGHFTRLAIANPLSAPYGRAAVQTLQALGAYPAQAGKLVQGENIGQALQFAYSGAAELALISYAQLKALPVEEQGRFWLVPESLHEPIRQEAILLRPGEHSQAAQAFLAFLQSAPAQILLQELGYEQEAARP